MTREGHEDEIVVTLLPGVKTVHLRYRVLVPRRYWPLGCVRNRCSLSGAIAPLPSEPAKGGVYLQEESRVLTPVQWNIEAVRFGDVPAWVPGSDPTPGQRDALGGDEIVVTRNNVMGSSHVAYPSVFWGRKWRRHRFVYQGVDVQVLHMDRRPAGKYPHETLLQYRADVPGHIDAIARETLDTAYRLGIQPPPDTDLVVVQGPLRSDVAQAHPTALTLTDEYLHVLPAARFRRFHEVQVARAVLDHVSLAYFTGHQDASQRLWVSGAVAFALSQVWQARRDLPDEDARDLLRNLSFMPAVDSFLYKGQASFASAYFRGGEDTFAVRNHPLWFSHGLPTGRRVHEKLDDLLDHQTLAAFYGAMVRQPRAEPVTTASRAWGFGLDWFFSQWLGPYPAVDYAVLGLESEKLANGRYRNIIRVGRDSARPIVEPVQLLVVEKGGTTHHLIWNGEAQPGSPLQDQPLAVERQFVIETDRPIKSIKIDPRYRNTESSRIPTSPGGRGDNNDPRFNNRRPGNRRFIYTGIGVNVAASEFLTAETSAAKVNAFSGFFAFEAGLRRDLRYTGTFNIFKDRETLIGTGGAANFYFLEKVNRQRRRLRLRSSMSAAWLTDGGLDPAGGVRLQESLWLTDDTRKFGFWPDTGHRVQAGVRISQVVRTRRDRSDDRHDLSFFAEHTQLFRIAHDHVLAAKASAEAVLPLVNELEYRALPRVGGLGGLSGFGADEVFGRAVMRAQMEYRHVFVNDLRFNFANLAWIRSIGGALFAGAATHSTCLDYTGLFRTENWRGQVGYGLTAYVHYLGVAPQLIRVEAAVPLGRRRTACMGQVFPDALAEAQGLPANQAVRLLPPVQINLLFNHPF
jgi:hypothetical protein